MADNSVTQLLTLINQQIESQEDLSLHLSKAQALTHIAMDDGFLDYPTSVLQCYLWVLSDIIDQTKIISEKIIDSLIKERLKPIC